MRLLLSKKTVWRLIYALTIAGLFVFCIVATVTALILSRFDGTAQLPADCGIVFGAAVYGNRPSMAVMRRVDAAVDLYHAHQLSKIFLTGGKGDGARLSEAAVMKARALSEAIPASALIMEDKARSTWENLLFTRPLTAQCDSVIGISDAFHLARIELLAHRQGWGDFRTSPAPRPESRSLEVRSFVREVAGYLYYALFLDTIWDIAPTAIYLEGNNRTDTPSILVN